MSRADPKSSTVAEAAGIEPDALREMAVGEPSGLFESAGALDIERAEALILQVARECARCPVNRRCPQEVCRFWREEQKARVVLEREGITPPTITEKVA